MSNCSFKAETIQFGLRRRNGYLISKNIIISISRIKTGSPNSFRKTS